MEPNESSTSYECTFQPIRVSLSGQSPPPKTPRAAKKHLNQPGPITFSLNVDCPCAQLQCNNSPGHHQVCFKAELWQVRPALPRCLWRGKAVVVMPCLFLVFAAAWLQDFCPPGFTLMLLITKCHRQKSPATRAWFGTSSGQSLRWQLRPCCSINQRLHKVERISPSGSHRQAAKETSNRVKKKGNKFSGTGGLPASTPAAATAVSSPLCPRCSSTGHSSSGKPHSGLKGTASILH